MNRWLRELPVNRAQSPGTWAVYARVLRDWMEFCAERGISVFAGRGELKAVLGAYAAHRADGPEQARFAASTWNRHVSVLSGFYQWAAAEGHAPAVPFSYARAQARYGHHARRDKTVNLATRRVPRAHVTVRYLEPDFAELFVRALAGLEPDGTPDTGFKGRELARNAAVARLALSTGLRRQEFSYLLSYEIPALPARPQRTVPFPVPESVTKGRKYRTTWTDYDALAAVHQYLDLDRAAATGGSSWRPPPGRGGPLLVTEPGPEGGRVNGRRVRWDQLRPAERLRLVAPGGGSCLLAVRGDGGPFTAWDSVFTRCSDRIRRRFEPRFPQVNPHRLRHTMAMATLERLVSGYYAQAAALTKATGGGDGPDAALALYLSKADPMMVLRDLLGHRSVATTELYLSRLDMTRIYADAYERAARDAGLTDPAARAEADEEFADDQDDDGDELAGPDCGDDDGGAES